MPLSARSALLTWGEPQPKNLNFARLNVAHALAEMPLTYSVGCQLDLKDLGDGATSASVFRHAGGNFNTCIDRISTR
jgi:hypothetical protein